MVSAVLACALFGGCGTRAVPPPPAPKRTTVCGLDETREFYCDDFLPLESAMPAPFPYGSCPATVERPPSQYEPEPELGVFDSSYTEYTRKRAPPGHSCCYSWCSKFRVADPEAPSARAACASSTAFREEYCMMEPESGASSSAGAPFERCPAAMVPPAKAVFHVPEAALFDVGSTTAHRGRGEVECCYAWCSEAPPGSGILVPVGGSRPPPQRNTR